MIAGLLMMCLLLFILLTLLYSQQLFDVKHERTQLYMALLREHRMWHKCNSGLYVEDGVVQHTGIAE